MSNVNMQPVDQIETSQDLLNEVLDLALKPEAPVCFQGMQLEVASGPREVTASRVVHLSNGRQFVVRVRSLR